jgi:DNA-binding transcriptional LysR family regulator
MPSSCLVSLVSAWAGPIEPVETPRVEGQDENYTQPQGVVKLAILICVRGQTLIGPLLANFLNEYPDVRLVSVLGDHVVHLLRSGFDLALAVGPLADSDLVAVKLGAAPLAVVAARGRSARFAARPRARCIRLGPLIRFYHRQRLETRLDFLNITSWPSFPDITVSE